MIYMLVYQNDEMFFIIAFFTNQTIGEIGYNKVIKNIDKYSEIFEAEELQLREYQTDHIESEQLDYKVIKSKKLN